MLFPTPILILTRERPPRPIFEVAEICGVVRVSNWLEFLHTLLALELIVEEMKGCTVCWSNNMPASLTGQSFFTSICPVDLLAPI